MKRVFQVRTKLLNQDGFVSYIGLKHQSATAYFLNLTEGLQFQIPELSSPWLNLWIPDFYEVFPYIGLGAQGWTKKIQK